MANEAVEEILLRSKNFFRVEFAPKHLKNTKRLTKVSEFTPNPFLWEYLATFLCGDNEPLSMARALIYPRVLGTSVTTTFGNVMQKFCSRVLKGFGSGTPGIDIEFVDSIDGRRKYCQLKSGPDSLNKDDIDTVKSNFKSAHDLALRNYLPIGLGDLVVGIIYGEHNDLNSFIRTLEQYYNVYVGNDFWTRLTGDDTFYFRLIKVFSEVAMETAGASVLEDVVIKLAQDIEMSRNGKRLER